MLITLINSCEKYCVMHVIDLKKIILFTMEALHEMKKKPTVVYIFRLMVLP